MRGSAVGLCLLAVLAATPTDARPRRRAAPAPATPLATARACADRADPACVIATLEGAPPPAAAPAAERAERLRLLAFAYARVGKHRQARASFQRWLALSPTHRLDRGQVPARVWPDYAAALLAHHGGALDLRPRVRRIPENPAVPMDWRALPTTPPPPRSARDSARDTELVLGPTLGGALVSPGFVAGVDLLVRVRLRGALRMGFGAVGASVPPDAAGGPRGVLAGLGPNVGYVVMQRPWGGVSVDLSAGGALLQRQDGVQRFGALLTPGVRWSWLRPKATLGAEVLLADRVLVGGGDTEHLVTVSLGVLLRPGSKSGRAAPSASPTLGQPARLTGAAQ